MKSTKLIHFFSAFIIILPFTSLKAQTYVEDLSQIEKHVSSAEAGDTIVIKNGIYPNEPLNINGNGSKDQPIVVMAETPGKVVFNGSITVSGKYTFIQGLSFIKNENRPVINLTNVKGARLYNNKFDSCGVYGQSGGIVVIQNNSSDNRIDHNTWQNSLFRCVRIINPQGCYNNRIDHNRFDIIPRSPLNSSEVVQLNNNSKFDTVKLRAIVENNYINRYRGDGSEVISVKSSHNIIRNNVIENSRGDITLRRGFGSIIEGNFIIKSGGIRIYGKNHKIIKNYIINPREYGLELGFGDLDSALYTPATNIILEENIVIDPVDFSVDFGKNRFAHNGHNEPAENISLSNNLFIQTTPYVFSNVDLAINISENGNFAYITKDADLSNLRGAMYDSLANHHSIIKKSLLNLVQDRYDEIVKASGCDF